MNDATKPNLIDFDHYSPDYAANWQSILDARHASGCPLAWSEAHGGYWLLTGYDAVKQASSTPEIFTSVNDVDGSRNGGKGVLIPQRPYQLTLNEEDPPVSLKYRMLEAPFFMPKFLKGWEELVVRHLKDAIDAVIERGECDLVADIAQPVTAKTTLHIVGIDEAEWEDFALPAHKVAFTPATHPDYPLAALNKIKDRLGDLLDLRRKDPRDDVTTKLANATIDGEPLGQQAAINMLIALVTGGFDTTVTLACHSLIWLEDQPEARARMLADSKVMDNAVEECLRAFSPTHGTARTAAQDVEFCGARLNKGERTMLSWAGANRDPNVFENPAEVRIDRPNAKDHMAFGGGAHRCLGAPLARLEVKMIITEVLRRIPDYRIDRDRMQPYPSAGLINGFIRLPIRFTPGTPG